jgi:hypothetical protein
VNINNPTTFGTPNLTLSTSNSSGTGGALRSDDTVLVYDTTAVDAITFGQSGSVGSAATSSRRDHAHAMSNTLVASGSYTGDGTTDLEVTGVGFQVKAVWIVFRQTSSQSAANTFFNTPQILDDMTGGIMMHTGGGAHRVDASKFVSFDSDGFSVSDAGANEDPNLDGAVYNYLCLG